MKPQDQRIKDAAEELALRLSGVACDPTDIARSVLEAADREPPKWPTEQSVSEVYGAANIGTHQVNVDAMRRGLRAAMLADPIVKAAVATVQAWADAGLECPPGEPTHALVQAVNKAGL